ncbi:DUF2254 domain-containing protein [Arthrobacter sp. B1805]|uniref:DUF2254 domain-containing protein n=1 Tax=Arthrobacter sp. B1805 TaxID=2058892 RepID=UPI000CE34A78|nr:DUF2254 domain-containing protein [Arthrobacter sp. B1805]
MDGQSVRESLRAQLWPIPLAAVLVALVLGQVLPILDERLDDSMPAVVSGVLFGGGPEAARSLLETIASSTITVTSLTFSLTVVTLQLASSQFSPRLLRTFTRDRFVHNTLALFLATFVFALTVLRSIRVESSAGASFVPEIAVTTAFMLTVASVVGLVLFLAHLARQIRVETMLRDVHRETDRTLKRIYPDQGFKEDQERLSRSGGLPLPAPRSGFLTKVDEEALIASATRRAVFVCVDVTPGASLIQGVPVARMWSTNGAPLDDERGAEAAKEVLAAFRTGFERTSNQDPSFGLQQLLDVTDKALSPGVNDPTTAVHALSHISAILCSLTDRSTGPRTLTDGEGITRVRLTLPAFTGLLELVMDQLITYAFNDPRTAARTIDMLSEITLSAARAGSLAHLATPLHAQVRRVRSSIDGSPLDSVIQQCLTDSLAGVKLWE